MPPSLSKDSSEPDASPPSGGGPTAARPFGLLKVTGVLALVLATGVFIGSQFAASEARTTATVTSSPTSSSVPRWIPPADADEKIAQAAADLRTYNARLDSAAAEVAASRDSAASSSTTSAMSTPTATPTTSTPTRTTEAPIAGNGGQDGDPDTLTLEQAIAFTNSDLADSICGAFAGGAGFDDIVGVMELEFDQSQFEFDAPTYAYTLAYANCPEYLAVQP